LARFGSVSLTIILFLALFTPGCKAQNATSGAALTPRVVRRIQNEIRSRYSVPQQVTISFADPEASDVPGYDKLVVTFIHDQKKTTFDFLVSKDRKTLARLEKIDISQDLMSKIDVTNRPVRGNGTATVTIINFDDFQCPFCSRMHATLFPGLLQAYGDRVKFIYKDYPLLEIHPWAMHAAVDANCLAAQSNEAYWDFADYVHGNQKAIGGKTRPEAFVNLDQIAREQGKKHQLDQEKLQACVAKQDETAVRASMTEADKLGIDSTPTLFIDGEKVSGAVPQEEMRAILDRALGTAGPTSAPSDARK
jgi:protein-disulfide isomerase